MREPPGHRNNPSWRQAAFLLSTALLLQGVASQITSLQTYPVDWATVPADPPTSRNLTANCNCDLLNIGCTLGCCCDDNCPSSVTEQIEAEGLCLASGREQQVLKFCVPDSFVAKVNLPSNGDFFQIPIEQANSESFIAQLLCIVSDSNPNIGYTFPDPPTGPNSQNTQLAQCPVAIPPATPSQTSYDLGGYVFVTRSALVPQPLRVPFPAFSAACNDEYIVGFLIPTPPSSRNYYVGCQRDLTSLDLRTACSGSGLLTSQYYSSLDYYTDMTLAVIQDFLVVSRQFLDPSTGVLSETTSDTPSYTAINQTCRNVMRYMNITFYFTPSGTGGTIDRAEMTFVLTDVSRGSTPFPQSVRVAWIETAQAATAIQYVASGNPGYIPGFPVLAGSLIPDALDPSKSAINRSVGGMPIAAPGPGGACSPTSLTFVGYGANISSSCSISLTMAQLEDFCVNEDNPSKYVAFVLSTFYNTISEDNLYFGIWGNSQVNNTNDWVKVSNDGSPSNQTTYSQKDKACLGVITGFSLQIVTGVAFASNNLQRKVLYANLCLQTGTWNFREELPANVSQRFYLNFDVSFIPLPQQAERVEKPAPPLVVYLPPDIFYPFVVSGATACRVSIWLAALAAMIPFLLGPAFGRH